MFKKLVHKICANKECAKHNVPQEPGLYLCENCQGELTPVYIWNKRALALVGSALGFLAAVGGAIGYEFAINRVAPAEALRILGGIDKLDKLQSSGRRIHGRTVLADGMVWYQSNSDFARQPFIRRSEGAAQIFRHRHQYVSGEEFRWKVITNLEHVYFFSESQASATLLAKGFGDGTAVITADAPPKTDEYYQMDENPGTERFVIVYCDKPIEAFEGRQSLDPGIFDRTVKILEKDSDVVVYHVELPHVKA